MYRGKRVVVVMPAYQAAKTLRQTYDEVMAEEVVDEVIVVDDASSDGTAEAAEAAGAALVVRHPRNCGYGGNQKTCYREAIARGADYVIMVHPDHQYAPSLVPALVAMLGSGIYDFVLGSRILCGAPMQGGMPAWKYVANRVSTLTLNVLFGTKLSEFHSGYRAYTRALLEDIPYDEFADDFAFDIEMIAGVVRRRRPIGEISCPARYSEYSSSIGFRASVHYGMICLRMGLRYRFGLSPGSCPRSRR